MRRLLLLLCLACAAPLLIITQGGCFAAADCVEYTVKAGDSCYNIALYNGINLQAFLSWNTDIDCSNLEIGQSVCVTDPNLVCTIHIVQAGDTCYDIAVAYDLTLGRFLTYNQEIYCQNLQIGQQVCVTSAGSAPAPPPPPPATDYNGNVFMEYIGALWSGVQFTDVPINADVDFCFILASAIDYTTVGGIAPTNGDFEIYWQNTVLTPAAVQEIKALHSNVKVLVSLGGDTVAGQSVYFSPTNTSSWVSNAVSSLTALINEYDLDGIDIKYQHVPSTVDPQVFADCAGQLITQLKESNVIKVATMAPFDLVEVPYLTLFNQYSDVIDYVNFQFYTYESISASQYVFHYDTAATKYGGGGKVLASFSTQDIGPRSVDIALSACSRLRATGSLPGVFVWSADTSYQSSNFTSETIAQALVADTSSRAVSLRPRLSARAESHSSNTITHGRQESRMELQPHYV